MVGGAAAGQARAAHHAAAHVHRTVERVPLAVPGDQGPTPAAAGRLSGELHQQHRGPGHEPVRRDPRRVRRTRRSRRRAVPRLPEALHRLRARLRGEGVTHDRQAHDCVSGSSTPPRQPPEARSSCSTHLVPIGRNPMNRKPLALAASATVAAVLVATPNLAVSAASAPRAAGALANLDHLRFLGDRMAPPHQSGHTTYQLARRPKVGTLWTYAEHQPDGSYKRLGGGTYDADTNTYGQGAFNADDMARASVVYLRHWRQTGSVASRRAAFDLLRGVPYLQTATGPSAGNVVLWMQPDGTLNRSAEPTEQPDPSDSDASYWLARTIWALGEGYADFKSADPSFARFLARRMDLAVAALDREVLDRYGQYLDIDGRRMPAWLVVDGADASAEAVLGLASYVRAGGGRTARTALRELSDGIAQVTGGNADHWPFGALQPSAVSRSVWHARGPQLPAAPAPAAVT